MRKPFLCILTILLAIGLAMPAFAEIANKTKYPIVFAHGMGGFDDVLGYDYWGDDYGTFVLDACDQFGEYYCNGNIDENQKSFVASVTPFHHSYQRGYELYQDIRSYMASTGSSYINIVGHSQGGLDLRKAAKYLYNYYGYRVVKFAISISSPHRGSPIAKHVLDMGSGVNSIMQTLGEMYGSIVYASGNDIDMCLKQLVYDDYEIDGYVTGCKQYNTDYPRSATYIACARSVITTQGGFDLNPALYLIKQGWMNIDGDGYASYDANNDGAMGTGDGSATDYDDDGMVGLNSQQMGYRLEYVEEWGLDEIYQRTGTGFCGNLNAPTSTMMTSHTYKLNQDHADVIGVGPDMFDEMEFYGAITDYIADSGY